MKLTFLFQIYTTFSTGLQLDGDNFFDFCGEGGDSFSCLNFFHDVYCFYYYLAIL